VKDLHSMGLRVRKGEVKILDQTRLPHDEVWLEMRDTQSMIEAIVSLRVRGAPLIGVAAALSLARLAEQGASKTALAEAAAALGTARPTAVNLKAAVDRVLAAEDPIQKAEEIFHEDVALCENMAGLGAPLIDSGDSVLTHCNSGGLATVGTGTALGVIRRAHEEGKAIHVYVDETRPLLQGARLTTWELGKLGIPHTLICDNMAASLMASENIQKVFVGADRVAMNGDFANKIGTYGIAVAAHHHGIPLYCVAPRSTIDWNCANGEAIPIEERGAEELRRDWSPAGSSVFNPAFDVTPVNLVSGLITDFAFIEGERLERDGLAPYAP
jgi:methylthioribose-1-phosphate isomerase